MKKWSADCSAVGTGTSPSKKGKKHSSPAPLRAAQRSPPCWLWGSCSPKHRPCSTESTPVETTPLRSQPTISLDLSTGDSPHIDALYDRGYTTVDELRGVTELIVRATPVSVDFESTVGRCWILRVEEADRKCPETIRLAQLKDEFLLEEGQEVVLALQLDHSTGRYYIPGGGDGLFRTDKNGTVSGKLLHSLLTQAPSSVKAEDLTLKTTFDLLTKQR